MEPLIYTSKGNLPIKDLEYKYWWTENDEHVAYHEQYLLGDEVVKESAAVKLKKVPSILGEQGDFNG